MMVSPRGFMEDSYDFVWCLVSFLSSYKLKSSIKKSVGAISFMVILFFSHNWLGWVPCQTHCRDWDINKPLIILNHVEGM
jgi:hypothetical protein